MDKSYMESVWWVFKQLYDKKAVYRGYKVMPYSTALTTPLSNNEAQVSFSAFVACAKLLTRSSPRKIIKLYKTLQSS